MTIDNSVKNIPKREQTKERETKPKTIKTSSLPRKQIKKLSQSDKKWVASGFGMPK